ncbi:MAG: elongation factor G [Candidatus Cyclonatronum sp.]|uniref:elongation factor G n=1 Tax=Cyclonatronum sp. TaxID=3024185 RepID=UPI0025BA56F2|nr:elongation factor G [Cyclonatronum sp.]MCC5932813.1 elongation factor G [Balneolales bacterium]MCH8485603.1 elongation factor G [Cyclonatronum sp.]
MNVYKTDKLRNVVLLGHSGSGKTTLAETMAFEAGSITRRGSVSAGSTMSDYHPMEKEKEKSVFTTVLNLDWRGHKINLIDTPGTADFIGEVVAPLRIARNNIFVINAEHGVEVGTDLLWKYARDFGTTSMIVINKLDHPNAAFEKAVDSCKERFGRSVVTIQFPYEEGQGFNAIIDVMKMTMYEFPEDGGKPEKLPIPESMKARADLLHNELVEAIAENDEMLMDLYFEKGTLDEEELIDGFRKSMRAGTIHPVFCVSAERNMGTGRVMGFIDAAIESPQDGVPSTLEDGSEFVISPDKPASAFIFKHTNEEHVGDLVYFKVTSGILKPGIDLYNERTNNTLRIGSLFVPQCGKRIEVPELYAGDIGVAVKLKDCTTNDTICDKAHPVSFRKVTYPEPTISLAVLADSGSEEKVGMALNQLQREDPALRVDHNAELRQLILSGQGEEHLNKVKHVLENQYKLHIEFGDTRIPYRETISKGVKTHYRHKKQSGGAGQFADVHLYIEPWTEGMADPPELNVRGRDEHQLEWGGKLVFYNCIVGGVIDNRFMPAILKGVMDKMENGPLSGCRARDIRVSVFDGAMHSVDSNEAAFKTAGMMAFKKGFLEAGPKLLEPVYEVDVLVPAEFMGEIMTDLSGRRGQIVGMDSEGSLQKVTARVPLAELGRYTTQLKSMTQGRATHTRRFVDYAQVPRDIQDRVMKENAEKEEDD